MLLRPEFTPSKVGGKPALICPSGVPPMQCPHCGYTLSFLAQLYANLPSEKWAGHHRMIYIFLCVSEKCIMSQTALQVWKCVMADENKEMRFATEDEFGQVSKLNDN